MDFKDKSKTKGQTFLLLPFILEGCNPFIKGTGLYFVDCNSGVTFSLLTIQSIQVSNRSV